MENPADHLARQNRFPGWSVEMVRQLAGTTYAMVTVGLVWLGLFSGIIVTDICYVSVRQHSIGGSALCFGALGYAHRIVHYPSRPDVDELTRTVEDIGYNITYAVWETYGVAIDAKWALHTRGLAMSSVTAGVLAFAIACHLAHHPLGAHVFATLVILITVVTGWIVCTGIRSDLKVNAPDLKVSPLGLILKLQLATFLVMFLGIPLVWFSKELYFELLHRKDADLANGHVHFEDAPDGNARNAGSGDRAGGPPSDGPIEMPRCRTPPPPVDPPLVSPTSTPSRPPTPSPPRTPPNQIRRARRTWDMETVDLHLDISDRAGRESNDAGEPQIVRHPKRDVRGGTVIDYLEPTDVPTGARPVPPDITPPRARVAKWRKTTTDAVDPRQLPRWNHDVPE